ncbi:putative epoxide hydrolase isoform X5 [Mirounga angustirostris]|uniref:putative epoxide hydrolase isoform X5 n=1 Tax=Mirounga angustirostris TaxID=9716 RepID=UPI00313C5384
MPQYQTWEEFSRAAEKLYLADPMKESCGWKFSSPLCWVLSSTGLFPGTRRKRCLLKMGGGGLGRGPQLQRTRASALSRSRLPRRRSRLPLRSGNKPALCSAPPPNPSPSPGSRILLQDLHWRIDRVRLTPPLEDVRFHFGFNSKYLRKVLSYWRNGFDWRKQVEILNRYPHFKTKIEGLDIHFIHVKPHQPPSGCTPKPLLMVHGWPGSFYEFYKIIPLLTDPRNHGLSEEHIFEVICPSIPGYGFSEASSKKGLNSVATARIFYKLMLRLGFQEFYVQGGDWGSLICTNMAQMVPSPASASPGPSLRPQPRERPAFEHGFRFKSRHPDPSPGMAFPEVFRLHPEGYRAAVPLQGEGFLQLDEGERLYAHPGHQTRHCGLRSERLSRGPGCLYPGEVFHLDQPGVPRPGRRRPG